MSWIDRLTNVLRHRDLNPEIDEELQFHIDSRIKDNIAAGLTTEEARRDALERFGGRMGIREQTRDANVLVRLETIVQDLVFAVRSYRKRPAFAVGALLTMALGIGASATILTVVRSVLLRPLPFPDSDKVCAISYSAPGAPYWLQPGLSDGTYLALRTQDRSVRDARDLWQRSAHPQRRRRSRARDRGDGDAGLLQSPAGEPVDWSWIRGGSGPARTQSCRAAG